MTCRMKCEGGEIFDRDIAIELATSENPGQSTRWRTLLVTKTGKYVISHLTRWQGERDTHSVVEKREAQEFFADFGKERDMCAEAKALMADVELI